MVGDYKSENVECEYISSASPDDLEEFIDKKVKKIISREYSLEIIFEDNTSIKTIGSSWEDCALEVECLVG